MEKVVLDSDIIIDYLRASKGHLPQLLRLQSQGKIEIYLSPITVFELFAGKSSRKEEELFTELFSTFKVIPFDFTLAKFAGEVKRERKLSITLADFIIGVTSLYLKASLATRNKDHFRGIVGLKFFRNNQVGQVFSPVDKRVISLV